jgi:hypothetical protein
VPFSAANTIQALRLIAYEMSRRRKHVTLALEQDIEPPGPGQAIVRALGTRGGNIVEVRARSVCVCGGGSGGSGRLLIAVFARCM